jgi:hypothetical protein
VPVWASASAARDDLRAFLNDGAEDRPVKNKLVVGPANGTNRVFFTFEERLVEASLAVSYDGTEQAAAVIDPATDYVMGRIVLVLAPPANTEVRARYYWQLCLDADLDEALRLAAGEIHETDDITSVEPGLKNAALHYAASFAYTKQHGRWLIQRRSEQFLLLEAPVENGGQQRAGDFKEAAQQYFEMAVKLRDSYHTRHGRREAPAFTVYKPRIPAVGPRR